MAYLFNFRRAGAALIPLFVVVSVVGCGRTELENAEPCDETVDTTRACTGFCGAGIQTCLDGTWHPCDVPETTRACTNDCGDGIERCFEKKWHTCEVEPVTRACSSACGDGVETCADNTWAECTAPKPNPPKLSTVVRDFHESHPDFELPVMGNNLDLDIVEATLGA